MTPFHVGQRVALHPASDWFMRGVRHGIVTSIRHHQGAQQHPGQPYVVYYVRPDTAGIQAPPRLRMRVTGDYLRAA